MSIKLREELEEIHVSPHNEVTVPSATDDFDEFASLEAIKRQRVIEKWRNNLRK
jgi:hypothetical protein